MGPIAALLLLTALASTFCAMYEGLRTLLSWGTAHRADAAVRAAGILRRCRMRLLSCKTVSRLGAHVRVHRRQEALRACMPDMLRLFSNALQAGSSLSTALEYASENCDEPLAHELKKTVWDLKSGQGFDEAMRKLRERTGGQEFSYLAVAMEIQHRAGGSLGGVLSTVSMSLQKASELEDKLQAQTAQGRLSARVVSFMPLVVLVALAAVSPGYLADFFTTPLGVVMLVLACVLEVVGVLLVRRVLAIDLSSGSMEETR